MKTLKRIGLGLLILIVLLAVIGFFLPRKSHVERSIVINAPVQAPFALVNDLTEWKKWSTWHKMDPNTKYEFSTPSSGTNAWFSWNSEVTGKGKMTLTDVKEFEYIKAKVEFDGYDASGADFFFKEENGTTRVTWTMDSDMGNNPFGRWMGLCMDKMIGSDYEKGLAGLKEESERAPVGDKVAGFSVELREMPAQKYLAVENKNVKPEEISIKIGENFMKLDEFIKQKKYTITGHPFTVWKDMANFSSAFPIAEDATSTKEFKFISDAGFTAYVVKYYGAYDKNEHVYKAMDQFIKDKNAKPAGAPREVYINDPMMEKDTAKWQTDIVFPVSK